MRVGGKVAVTDFVFVGTDVFLQNNVIGVLAGRVMVGRGVPGVRIFPAAVRVENRITTMERSTSERDTNTLTNKAIVRVVPDKLVRCCNGHPHS
jgi:hypothetical protein